MWGTYQQSSIRIELDASASEIRQSLIDTAALKEWLAPQQLYLGDSRSPLVGELATGQSFESVLGPLKVSHRVEVLSEGGIRLLLSKGIDGFHEWQWGDGWVQSRLEGISLLPLNLGQTASITRLRRYLQSSS